MDRYNWHSDTASEGISDKNAEDEGLKDIVV